MQLQELPSNYLLLCFVDLALMAVEDNCVQDSAVFKFGLILTKRCMCYITAYSCHEMQKSSINKWGHDYTKINVYYVS